MKALRLPSIVVALLALSFVAPPRASAIEPLALGAVDVQPFFSNRARGELVDWFDQGAGGADGSYAFFANVIRFGARASWEKLTVTVEGQEVALLGLPDDAALLGPGGVYYANTADEDQRELHLRQGFARWNDLGTEGLALQGGRFVFNDGLETQAQDPSLAWLKKLRVSQRLLGGFDYTHVGRSFDGGLLDYDISAGNVTAMAGVPTAGGFNISANKNIDDIVVAYGAWTITEPESMPRTDARLFYLYYSDERGLTATDNRPEPDRAADDQQIDIHTIGANAAQVMAAGPGEVDFLVWVAGQFGDWESLDHEAYAFSLEAGYRFVDIAAKPWVRIGWSVGSGDDDPDDGTHATFFQALPTARLYARTPFFNMMNNNDLFAQLVLAPAEGLAMRADYHYLQAAEKTDLIYAGGGATQNKPIFGYAGFPAADERELAHFLDLSVDYTLNAHVKMSLYYGHAFGGDAVDANFAGDSDLNYGYLELTLTL